MSAYEDMNHARLPTIASSKLLYMQSFIMQIIELAHGAVFGIGAKGVQSPFLFVGCPNVDHSSTKVDVA
jgi:hypothetical protein